MTHATPYEPDFSPLAPSEKAVAKIVKPSILWLPLDVVPDDAGKPDFRHSRYGNPVMSPWEYRCGQWHGYIARYHDENGRKQFFPFVWCRSEDGRTIWRMQGFREPRPLYRLPDLLARAESPVVVCEGEKAAAAAQALLPEYIVITSAGGAEAAAKTDWTPIKGRALTIWPDNDAAGQRYAEDVARIAHEAGAHSVTILTVPEGPHEKWDAADALAEGWTPEQATQWVKSQTSDSVKNPDHLSDTVMYLAALSPLEYDRVRETESKRLGVRVSVLDKEVSTLRREREEAGGKRGMFPVVESWPHPVDGAELLADLRATFHRHIVCDCATAIAASLWCVFTWCIDHVQVAPLAVITAPEKRCGKSQMLTLIGKLSRRPLVASNISPAATYRVIEAYAPTLLIDEADSFFKENEELRGVINSGHTRQSAYVIRTVGDDHEPCQFSTWGAKAISGIGTLSETLMDRAVVLELRRKLPHENVERLRHTDASIFDALASRLARFAQDMGSTIARARPHLPDVLNDRAQDNWEPLFAIADVVGGEWPSLARDAALKLSGTEQEAVSLSAELLADIQEVFETKKVERITTADLLQALCEDDLKPWATYGRGNPMTPRQLARRLGEYRIESKNLKIGYGDVKKGFERSQFEDAFSRYIASPSTPENAATALPNSENQGNGRAGVVADTLSGSATQKASATMKCAEILEGSVVAANSHPSDEDMVEVDI